MKTNFTQQLRNLQKIEMVEFFIDNNASLHMCLRIIASKVLISW